MTTSAIFFTILACVQGQQVFLQTAGEPLEVVENVKQVPVVGGQFSTGQPVPTAMQCVVSLTIQFMVIYTALAVCRMAADGFGLKYDNLPIQKILQTATLTVAFAPMLAILFLAFRMRVNQLTKNKGNPPVWAQICMYFCTYAILLMTLIVCVIPLFTGETIGVDPKTGDINQDTEPFKSQACAIAFTALKYLILIMLYGGVLAVVYAICTFQPPPPSFAPGQATNTAPTEAKTFPVAPAVQCTMILACQYFLVYGGIQVARTWTQFMGEGRLTKVENALMTATASMNFAPMLAVLFIGARMRALNMDPINGNPQKWAQNCFFMCTYALLAQTICSVAVPLVLQGSVKIGKCEGDMEYEVENKMLGTVLVIGRYVMMICIYVGVGCVIYSIFTIQHPKGPQYTIPISPTMQCVINLTFQFFFVYIWIWAAITVKEFTGFEWALMTQTMENCKGVVMFCPMLSILFVATRMLALQLTDSKGAPQGWAQDGMYMATWSLLIQFVMVLITPCATGVPAEVDEDGNIKWEPENKILFYCVVTIRALGFILLYAGIVTVIIGLYTMTPETANGRGAVPLVGDGKVPGVGAQVPGYEGIKEPYGVNDVPGTPIEQKF
jgi:hypothetical protein